MFKLSVATENFSRAIHRYSQMMQRGMGEVVKEQARLFAERAAKLTPPKSAGQGKKRVEADIGGFTSQTSGFPIPSISRVKPLGIVCGNGSKPGLTRADNCIPSLCKIEEAGSGGISAGRHLKARDSRGRVRLREPNSFPVDSQSKVRALVREKKKAVGLVKGSFGHMVKILGGRVAGWMDRRTGEVIDDSGNPGNPSVTLTNKAYTAASVCGRLGVIEGALAGRAKDMIKSAERRLKQAQEAAGL